MEKAQIHSTPPNTSGPNDGSAALAKKFMENSNKLINEALAMCEIQGFTPVPLEVPQMIQANQFQDPQPPDVHAFFKQAELVWNDMLMQVPDGGGQKEITEMLAGKVHSD